MQMTRVRIRETGQVLDMVPDAARAMIGGGIAEKVISSAESTADPRFESMSITNGADHAVTAAHSGPARKATKAQRR